MMTPQEISHVLFAEPFRPFRINMASGKSYEIRHPEVVDLAKSRLTIYTPMVQGAEGEETWKKISLMLVESIEPLQTPIGKNGE